MRYLSVSVCLAVLSLQACRALSPIPRIDPYRIKESGGPAGATSFRGTLDNTIPNTNSTFAARYLASSSTPTDKDLASSFLKAGIALSDDLCADWFQQLGQAQVKTNSFKDLSTNVGALTTTLLAVSGAGTAAVSSVAAGSAFANKTLDSAQANFIVAPDIGLVQRAISAERSIAASEMTNTRLDFYDSYRMLVQYDNLCSHNEVKRVVNVSLSNQTEKTVDQNEHKGKSPFYDSIYLAAKPQFEALFPAEAIINDHSILALYAIYGNPATTLTPTQKEAYKKVLTDAKLFDGSKLLFAIKTSEKQTDAEKKAALEDAGQKMARLLASLNAVGDLEAALKADIAKPTS